MTILQPHLLSNVVVLPTHSMATKFTCEMSSKCPVFFDTEVFKELRFVLNKILDVQTHFKATEMFQYTNFFSWHPLSIKKGLIKGEILHLLWRNSIKEKFESSKQDFKFCPFELCYTQKLVKKIQAKVDFSSQNNALKYKLMRSENILQPRCTETQRDPNEELEFDHWQPEPCTNLSEWPHCRLHKGQITQRPFSES